MYNVGDRIQREQSDITILDRKQGTNGLAKYLIHCNICGQDGWHADSTVRYGKIVCSICSGKKIIEGINNFGVTNPWMNDYVVNLEDSKKYSAQSQHKIIMKCPYCGKIHKTPITISQLYRDKKISCDCRDGISYPNKFMSAVLNQLQVTFQSEYQANWCKPYKYDFYLKQESIIIEMDGALGHGNKLFNNKRGFKTIEESAQRDVEKNILAEQQGIKVLRIDCRSTEFADIVSNIKLTLSEYFNLNNVNFKECEKLALGNKIKEVCSYYMQNQNATFAKIAKDNHICQATLRNYLRRGSLIGWCNYSADDKRKHNSKMLYIYDTNNMSAKNFTSYSEASKTSKENYGIFIPISSISKAILHNKGIYKNLIFSNKPIK